jgi:hypothetical protein
MAQFGRAKTQFLYLGGGAIPHRQDSSPNKKKEKQPDKTANHRNHTEDPRTRAA